MGLLDWLFGKKRKTLPEWVKDRESYQRWKSGWRPPNHELQTKDTPAIKIEVEFRSPVCTSSSEPEYSDTGPVIPSNDGGFILNPKRTFPLTIYEINRSVAEKLKKMLDEGYSQSSYQTIQRIMPIVTRYNIRCREIDDYIHKFRPLYLARVEEIKKTSPEWAISSELDKEDLLIEYAEDAIESLDVRPDCNLRILFEGESVDTTIDDELIDRFGYDNISFYLTHSKGIHTVPADHPGREMYENLVAAGLAIRGDKIPLTTILEKMKLKELFAIVSDLNPPKFTRKATAIEFIAKLPDLRERLDKTITLFQIQPLSKEFSHIDLNRISTTWRYAREISTLIERTYVAAGHATHNRDQHIEDLRSNPHSIKSWEIVAAKDGNCCPFCIRASNRRYPKDKYPIVPLHRACRCMVLPILVHT